MNLELLKLILFVEVLNLYFSDKTLQVLPRKNSLLCETKTHFRLETPLMYGEYKTSPFLVDEESSKLIKNFAKSLAETIDNLE